MVKLLHEAKPSAILIVTCTIFIELHKNACDLHSMTYDIHSDLRHTVHSNLRHVPSALLVLVVALSEMS